jgi:hypothetical protein
MRYFPGGAGGMAMAGTVAAIKPRAAKATTILFIFKYPSYLYDSVDLMHAVRFDAPRDVSSI